MDFVFYLLIVLASILTHEAAHVWAFRFCGIPVRDCSVGFTVPLLWWTDRRGTCWHLRLLPLGGYAAPHKWAAENINPRYDIFVSACGPVANAVIAAFLVMATTFTANEFVVFAAYINAMLAAVNLLPLHPMDGGRMLLAYLRLKRRCEAEDDAVVVAVGLLGFVGFLAVMIGPAFLPEAWEPFAPAQRIEARSDETPKAAQPEGREPDPEGDAPESPKPTPRASMENET